MSLIFAERIPVYAILVAAAASLWGCDAPPPGSGVAQAVTVDLEEARQELLQQDQLFAETLQAEGVARAFQQFLAPDAVQLQDGGPAIGGREEIYRELRALTEGATFSLTWEALDAEVAASGELGYTWGIYYFESEDELGAPYVAEGKYVFIWRNNGERWELALDITNQTEPDYTDESSDYDDYAEWNEEAGLDAAPPSDGAGT